MKIIFLFTFVSIGAAKLERKIIQTPLPADVLRDYPGRCFLADQNSLLSVGQYYILLNPMCAGIKCIRSKEDPTRLIEMVLRCAPLPKENPKCRQDEKYDSTLSFPFCCPTFECEEGEKLEYPDTTTMASNTTERTTKN